MQISGEMFIHSPRQRVWDALQDVEILECCIEGVERLERVGDNRFDGTMNVKVGPVRAKFTGGIALTEIDAPKSYVIVGEGKGGVAGFAKGKAHVALADHQDASGTVGTMLSYTVSSTVGGKLAQLGARLIEGAAKGYAESFFRNFKARLEPTEEDGAVAESTPQVEHYGSESEGQGLPAYVWVSGLTIIIAALLAMLLMRN